MADYWGWGWGDPNGHLRVSGRRLLEWADRVGWSLYADERAALERASEIEVYLDQPLDELDVVSFGAAVEKFRGRSRKTTTFESSSFERPAFRHDDPKADSEPDAPPRKQKKAKRPKRGRDDQRGRRWR